ncbi:hypothetical protein [Roseibium marinum]|uniref:Uncharacterized protein n=1 Tax=Roseibium marinum TaxID=281252 RepID=A0A2S3UVG7_9HYPH|nr:hypothetical protein [Roseibium marinum]POF31664.1 hypothetical protein CLV41_104233 [Roseibium marinum]
MFPRTRPSSTATGRSLFLAAKRLLSVFAGFVGVARAFRSEWGLLSFPETMTKGSFLRRHDLRGWFDHEPAPRKERDIPSPKGRGHAPMQTENARVLTNSRADSNGSDNAERLTPDMPRPATVAGGIKQQSPGAFVRE